MQLTKKQLQAMDLMTDPVTKVVGYGGAAGGGKTVLGCYLFLVLCKMLPNTRWFIGRDELKLTRESVLITWRKTAKMMNIKGWRYSDDHIYFDNGSEVIFLDLSFYPKKDPMYERFGSMEFTGGWIEEAGSCHPKAYEVLKVRVGRWFNEEYNIIGKILVTFNPKKNWLYAEFWKPFKTNAETALIRFIPAYYTDNEHLTEDYVKSLQSITDLVQRARLLNGDFDYDDDETALIMWMNITNIWSNFHVKQDPNKYLTADIARFGSDKAIILIWEGLSIIGYSVFSKSSITLLQSTINAYRVKFGIPATNCIADEDGVGGGVVDNCRILGFVNGSRPFDKAYATLKDQCGYILAEKIIGIYVAAQMASIEREEIETELGQLKTWKADEDGKLRIMPKAEIKANIGRSPDWLDNFIMRMYFFLDNTKMKSTILERARAMFN